MRICEAEERGNAANLDKKQPCSVFPSQFIPFHDACILGEGHGVAVHISEHFIDRADPGGAEFMRQFK